MYRLPRSLDLGATEYRPGPPELAPGVFPEEAVAAEAARAKSLGLVGLVAVVVVLSLLARR
jgi:hypothetical protein